MRCSSAQPGETYKKMVTCVVPAVTFLAVRQWTRESADTPISRAAVFIAPSLRSFGRAFWFPSVCRNDAYAASLSCLYSGGKHLWSSTVEIKWFSTGWTSTEGRYTSVVKGRTYFEQPSRRRTWFFRTKLLASGYPRMNTTARRFMRSQHLYYLTTQFHHTSIRIGLYRIRCRILEYVYVFRSNF